jgi:alpha-glucosidase
MLHSPDGGIEVRITSTPLEYSIQFQGRPVVLPSPLGLSFRGVADVSDWQVARVTRHREDRTLRLVYGKTSTIRERYQELALFLSGRSDPARRLEVQVRAFNDGVALRYRVPRQPALDTFVVEKELTAFRFAGDPTVWAGTTGRYGYHHAYEQEYPERPLSTLVATDIVVLPLLVRTSAAYAAITESDLTDWAGMYLRRNGESLDVDLSPRLDGEGLVKSAAPRSSPWRVVLLAGTAGKMIESNIVEALNAPSRIADPSWIKPGKTAWDRWWSADTRMDDETIRRFISFAGEMGFPYQLIDWGWSSGRSNTADADITGPTSQLDLPGLIRFARERNVREWVWLHSNDVNRYLKEGRLDEAFATYERWGLAGVKIDFMERNDQEMVNWYHTVLELAARHHLMVDFHGAYVATGLQATWPNLVTQEGVLGNEWNKMARRVTPTHKVTLAYTRLLAGPMDFTPGGFLNRSPAEWRQTKPTEVMGSRAQELALFVVYFSPLTCVADDPVHYEGQPGLEFLRAVPTVWDETRFLQGDVARDIVLARRNGSRWFLGAMTADAPSERKVSLSFLGKGRYHAHIFADPADPNASYEALTVSTREVTAADSLDLKLRPAGGAAVYFEPLR